MFGALNSSGAAQPKQSKIDQINLMPKPLGMNASGSSNELQLGELWGILNWVYTPTGALTMRPGLTKHTNTAVAGDIEAAGYVTLAGTSYMLIVNDDHKLYYLDGSEDPVYIGQLEGKPVIIPYTTRVVFCDGGYLKYWDGTTFNICYDDGDGTHHTATQFDNVAGTSGGTIALGDATSKLTRIAYKFTSQTWTSGYTIPPTQFKVSVQAEGTLPATTIYARIRRVSDDAIIAEKTVFTHAGGTITAADDIPGTQTTITATLTSSDVTTEMSPNQSYYASFEWPGGGGDDVNYIKVHHSTETAGLAYTYDVLGGYTADVTKSPLISLYPGMPYKASDGVVETDSERLWILDATTQGNMPFSNVRDLFDMSTDDGGGYININSLPIGAVMSLFGDIYAIGTSKQPFFAKITGTQPDDYAMQRPFEYLTASTHSAVNAIHDGIFANEAGIFTISGVEQYGDLRFANVGQPIRSKTYTNWGSGSHAAYNANTGEYLIKMEGINEVFVGNSNLMTEAPEGLRMPWTMVSFGNLTPTCLTFMDGGLYIGMDNGHLYRWDNAVLTDDGATPDYVLTFPNVDMLADEVFIQDILLSATVEGQSGTFKLAFEKLMSGDTVWATGDSWVTGITWGSATHFTVDVDTTRPPYNVWVGYRTRQFQMSIVKMNCGRVSLSGAIAQIERMQI